ncbi:DUF397 domain-containing protein [Streptomyces sp. NPDC004031]
MSSPQRPSLAELAAAPYRKSSYSGANNECVEIATLDQWVGVRDSKDPDGPKLCFTAANFAIFLADLRTGHLTR